MLDSEVPKRPEKLISEFVQTNDALFVTYRPRRGPGKITFYFLMFFFIFWTYGCATLTWMAITKQDLLTFLFDLPFLASWCFLLVVLANIFFGVERLAVTADGIGYEQKIIWGVSRRFLPRSEILSIASAVASIDSDNGSKTFAVEIVATGHKQLFGQTLSNPECDWIARTIRDTLKFKPLAQINEEPVETIVENVPTVRPSDSDWYLEDDGNTMRWRNAGRLNWTAVFGLLFVNLFWNGIVSVFIAHIWGIGPADQPQKGPNGGEWWCLFFFLIPFELIGLVMFVGLLASISDVFRRTVWTFRLGSVECRHRWLLFTRTKQFEFDSSSRLVARETPKKPKKLVKSAEQTPLADDRFELAILGTDDVAICTMTGLTIGDARWMKHEIESRRPRWFQF